MSNEPQLCYTIDQLKLLMTTVRTQAVEEFATECQRFHDEGHKCATCGREEKMTQYPVDNKPLLIEGVWLRRIGTNVQVLVEVQGEWRLCIEECYDSSFSHIIEPDGIRGCQVDPLTTNCETFAKFAEIAISGREDGSINEVAMSEETNNSLAEKVILFPVPIVIDPHLEWGIVRFNNGRMLKLILPRRNK